MTVFQLSQLLLVMYKHSYAIYATYGSIGIIYASTHVKKMPCQENAQSLEASKAAYPVTYIRVTLNRARFIGLDSECKITSAFVTCVSHQVWPLAWKLSSNIEF